MSNNVNNNNNNNQPNHHHDNNNNNSNLFATLSDDLVVHIVTYLQPKDEALTAALVCQRFHGAVEAASQAALVRINNDQTMNVDADFWLRVHQRVEACPFFQQRRPGDSIHVAHGPLGLAVAPIPLSMLLTSPEAPVPARILWKAARTIPFKQFLTTMKNSGPTVMLPDGTLAIACFNSFGGDGLIRIFDPTVSQFTFCEQRAPLLARGGPFDYGDALYYAKGHLVMRADQYMSVWELEYAHTTCTSSPNKPVDLCAIHFRHRTRLKFCPDESRFAVGENGKVYIMTNLNYDNDDDDDHLVETWQSAAIEVYDIASGQHLQHFPCNNNIPSCYYLHTTSTHLFLFRVHTDLGRDDGFVALDMQREQLQMSTWFDLAETASLHVLGVDVTTTGCLGMIFRGRGSTCRMISIDDSGILQRQELTNPDIWVAHHVAAVTRIFGMPKPITDIIKIHECNLLAGGQGRTLSTGILQRGHDIRGVFSNDTTVVCTIESDFTITSQVANRFIIQSFLL